MHVEFDKDDLLSLLEALIDSGDCRCLKTQREHYAFCNRARVTALLQKAKKILADADVEAERRMTSCP